MNSNEEFDNSDIKLENDSIEPAETEETEKVEETEETELTEETGQTEEVAEKGKKKEKEKRTVSREIFDWVEVLVLSLSFVLLTFSYLARQAMVEGGSMEKTFYNGERIIISDLFYTPKQGDIIVFQVPHSSLTEEPIIKRVIAVGGQTVYIDFENWLVYVYDDSSLTVEEVKATVKPLDEPYIEAMRNEKWTGYSMKDSSDMDYPYTVEKGKLFCMGDNRNGSTDSRSHLLKTVDERYILGKVLFRINPFTLF